MIFYELFKTLIELIFSIKKLINQPTNDSNNSKNYENKYNFSLKYHFCTVNVLQIFSFYPLM